MIKLRGKNKNELLVLTGAIYSFVAYLMAFTLEVLFLIDLARRTSDFLASSGALSSADQLDFADSTGGAQIELNSNSNSNGNNNIDPQTGLLSGFSAFDSLQTHRTVSCLAIAILYFIIFIASLVLIVALILRSTFMLLIWMCAMTTMYLPEFGLVVYVSVYSWGLATRNGQTELVFYLFRGILNLVFIFKAHRLFKQWSYEKSFYRLKSSSQFTGYDSPYFVGDSLTTTINPVFSPTSTLNNSSSSRYDRVRDSLTQSPASIFSLTTGGAHGNLDGEAQQQFSGYSSTLSSRAMPPADQRLDYRGNRLVATAKQLHPRELNLRGQGSGSKFKSNHDQYNNQTSSDSTGTAATPKRKHNQTDFYIGETLCDSDRRFHKQAAQQDRRQSQSKNSLRMENSTSSMLSINDDFPEYELDLDYRTLSHGRNNPGEQTTPQATGRQHYSPAEQRYYQHYQHHDHHHHHHYRRRPQETYELAGKSPDALSYSTQSLDRRHLRDIALPDQVILRPLGHQPFEYLHRPGSSSNINSSSNLNTQPSSLYSSHAKLTKRYENEPSHRRF